jgi:hypothetical protein
MSWEDFYFLIPRTRQRVVSLQGEGEPTLWPHFIDAVHLLKKMGFKVTTITNGSTSRVLEVIDKLDSVMVSIDTMDEKLADDIGRHNLPKVLKNLEGLKPYASKIIITSVDFGQSLVDVRKYAVSMGFRWTSQKLQPKDDYKRIYPQGWSPVVFTPKGKKLSCTFLSNHWLDFYNIDGLHRPCCYIKSNEPVDPLDMYRKLSVGIVPHTCSGCSKIEGV